MSESNKALNDILDEALFELETPEKKSTDQEKLTHSVSISPFPPFPSKKSNAHIIQEASVEKILDLQHQSPVRRSGLSPRMTFRFGQSESNVTKSTNYDKKLGTQEPSPTFDSQRANSPTFDRRVKRRIFPTPQMCFSSLVFVWMIHMITFMKVSLHVALDSVDIVKGKTQTEKAHVQKRILQTNAITTSNKAAPIVPKVTSSVNNQATLPSFLDKYGSTLYRSDFVELDHCNLTTVNWENFTNWALPIVEKNKPTKALQEERYRHLEEFLTQEHLLELLEMHATHSGLCNFQEYRPTITPKTKSITEAGEKLQSAAKKFNTPEEEVCIVYSIVAYRDAKHLKRLIEAIHLPQHLIIIHLEQTDGDNEDYIQQVKTITNAYSNVVIVNFGTIIYKSDSVSRITLQLMNWVVNELKLEFDYFATLGGAVYPLFGAKELSRYLYTSKGNVWLGEATMKGAIIQESQSHLLWKKRLLTTSSKIGIKAGRLFNDTVPDWMDSAMQHKGNSGNQAMFSYSIIRQMLESPRVLQMFAMAKYACCCCVEERTWIAAMDMIGHLDEAKSNTNMFQLWGGKMGRCVATMQNAVLDLNETRCFRDENPITENLYFWGNSTWDHLVRAKERGILFARKFDSGHDGSVELLEKIESELHAPLAM